MSKTLDSPNCVCQEPYMTSYLPTQQPTIPTQQAASEGGRAVWREASHAEVAEWQPQGPGKRLPSPEPQSIYSTLSPSQHSEPEPFFLRGLQEKSTRLLLQTCCPSEGGAPAVRWVGCFDAAFEVQKSRRPLLPGNCRGAWTHSKTLRLLAPPQHPATEAAGTLGSHSRMNTANEQKRAPP